MKLCPTCGTAHPDDVTTSHHPNDCTCGSRLLHAPDGNNQGPKGCVWSRFFVTPIGQEPPSYSDTVHQFEKEHRALNPVVRKPVQ